ncbi:MAG: hypothetical protein CL840_14340 [Crocinitomicaceae bacterium]|nr:hypothetical protein [Crocinitomicaceae bacterium]|tara:strand:- start:995 stop:1204 length:210 start_codon:yes stop_codon:yes gene_type:complete
MNNWAKLFVVVFFLSMTSMAAKAETSVNKLPDYTIRKDSLSTTPQVDTTKRTVTFPNPFNVFIINEEKK